MSIIHRGRDDATHVRRSSRSVAGTPKLRRVSIPWSARSQRRCARHINPSEALPWLRTMRAPKGGPRPDQASGRSVDVAVRMDVAILGRQKVASAIVEVAELKARAPHSESRASGDAEIGGVHAGSVRRLQELHSERIALLALRLVPSRPRQARFEALGRDAAKQARMRERREGSSRRYAQIGHPPPGRKFEVEGDWRQGRIWRVHGVAIRERIEKETH